MSVPIAVGADQHVADPDRVRVLALQRALVERRCCGSCGTAWSTQQPVLQVLAVVGEVDAEQLGVAAGAGVLHVADQPDQVAAEGDHDVLEAWRRGRRRRRADRRARALGGPVLHGDER